MNEYTTYLPGEQEALEQIPRLLTMEGDKAKLLTERQSATVDVNEAVDGWRLVAVEQIDGGPAVVLEKHATYRGVIAYVTPTRVLASIPKWVGDLARIRPRQVTAPPEVQLRRKSQHVSGPDIPGDYILNSNEDPTYENVAALGKEYIGWTLVANEQSGPEHSLYLEPDGTSRELKDTKGQAAWAQDEFGPACDPQAFHPTANPQNWEYTKGHSKRTLLAGYLPVADIGVWNPEYNCGYESMVLMPEGDNPEFMARQRTMIPEAELGDVDISKLKVYRDEKGRAFTDSYVNCDATSFFMELLAVWRRWSTFFESSMPVEIPDEWLLAGARAGIVLCRCSYRGLEPTYQIGEGAYTMIPERSHALFPVAEYEFVWAHQLWNLTASSDKYFQFYLDRYILPDGNFLYNTQDQVEAPLCVGIMLANSARGYFYEGNLSAFQQRLPVLRRMIAYVLERYEYTKANYPAVDAHHGLIWGSPEADFGNVQKDRPSDHMFYYENAAGVWRGLQDHAEALARASGSDPALAAEAAHYAAIAKEMRGNIERSLQITLAKMSPAMKFARITPFTPEDIDRDPKHLESYENHRFMQDWFLADWGDNELDLGHLRHREIAGMQLVGLHVDDDDMRTSNFMEHGTLAVRIRQPDYRPFLLTLYGLACFTMDSGNRYSPEDAMIPDGHAGEGVRYWWSSVVNSALQPAMGLRWLLCYEESDRSICHLQKAAPRQWFRPGEHIAVQHCPTRFGHISWRTDASVQGDYVTNIEFPENFTGDLHIHFHPPNGSMIQQTSFGRVEDGSVILDAGKLAGRTSVNLRVL